MHRAIDELGKRETFRGYGPEQGYEFLRSAIAQHDYRDHGMAISRRRDLRVRRLEMRLRFHPGYLGRSEQDRDHRSGLSGLRRYQRDGGPHRSNCAATVATKALLIFRAPRRRISFRSRRATRSIWSIFVFQIIPTGAVASRDQLTRWVEYAREHDAILLFDAAYEAYISEPGIPHSIYEIEGARECAIEFRSFSKTGGFTGVRCGFTVMPKSLLARTE